MSGPSKSPTDNLVFMGRIGAAHGIRGEVRIQSFTEDPAALPSYSPFTTNKPDLTITVTSARPTKNVVVAKIKGITDRTDAEKLNGIELYISRDRLPDPDEDEFYMTDLIGLEARLSDGTVHGKVLGVPNFGADDLIEIELEGNKTELYPFTHAVVPEIHLKDGYLVILPPDEIIVEGEE